MVLADFPLLLLDPDRRVAYDKVVEWLRRDSVQEKIMRTTFRRPVSPAVLQARCLGKMTGWRVDSREVMLEAIAIFR